MFLIIPCLIIGIIVKNKYIPLKGKLYKPLNIYIILTLYSIIGIFITSSKGAAFIAYIRLFSGMLIFLFLGKCIQKEEEVNFLKRCILIIAIIASLTTYIGMYCSFIINTSNIYGIEFATLYYGGVYRPVGIAGGAVANGILLYTLIMAIRAIRCVKKRKIYNFIEILCVVALLGSLTRTVILAAILAYILEKCVINISIKNIISIVSFSLLIIIIASFILPEDLKRTFIMRFVDFGSGDINDFGAGRVGIWISILTGIYMNFNIFNFIFGYGIEMAPIFVEKYSIFRIQDATHNDFLDILVTNGIVGVFLLVIFYINILWRVRSFKTRNMSKLIISWIIPYCLVILNLSNTNFSADQRWMFILVIILIFNLDKFNNNLICKRGSENEK